MNQIRCGELDEASISTLMKCVKRPIGDITPTKLFALRSKTDFVKRWYERQLAVLDEKLELLRANPSTQPDCCIEYVPGTKYPLHWNELLGRIFHEEASKHTDRIIFSIPTPGFEFYR